MDRRNVQRLQSGDSIKQPAEMKLEANALERAQTQKSVLRDLNAELSVRAERMKLLSRAEEGLVQESFNPYATTTIIEKDENEIVEHELRKKDLEILESTVPSKIPVSAARERRRKRSTQADKQKSTLQIKNYRPGYTWNRGGRVKELRIRFLARKHLHRWQRKTFGRVLPSVARHHYEMRIKKAVFEEWKTMWWEVRKEWRLMIRAECHYRYIIWLKVFQTWKEFVCQQKQKSEQLTIAVKHYNRTVLKKIVVIWKHFIDGRREINKQKALADELYQRNVTRRVWSVWDENLSVIQHRQQMEVVALQFWAYRVQVQHWLIWCDKMNKRRDLFQKHIFAARHYRDCQKRKCLHAWIRYWLHRREKRKQKEYSKLLYEKNLKLRVFLSWIRQWHMQLSIQSHEAHIQELGQRFRKRQIFEHWKLFVEIRKEKEDKLKMADLYYVHKLLVLGFSCFRLHAVQQRIKRHRNALALQHYKTMLVGGCWEKWMARCEHNEELDLIPQTRKALAHYRYNMLHKCWQAFQLYVEWSQHRKQQYARADAFFYLHAMPEYLYRMRLFVQIMKEKRENEQKALEFRKENVQARFFYKWYTSAEQSRENRLNERIAIVNYDDCLRRRLFGIWKTKTALVLKDKDNEEMADEQFNILLCKRCLQAWTQYVQIRKVSRKNGVTAARHHYVKVLRSVMKSWKQFVWHQKEKKRKIVIATNFYHKKMCTKVFQSWVTYTSQGRQFSLSAETKYQAKCTELLRWSFRTWRENVVEQITERQSECAAQIHHNRYLLQKILTSWHRYAVTHAYKKSETKQWVESIKEELQKNKLRRYFTIWKENRDDTIIQKLKYEQAVRHHQRILLTHVVETWKTFTHVTIRKNLLSKQCAWFNKVRLTSTYFSYWKLQHQLSMEEDRKTDIALWHWSLVLQKKVLVAWYSYMEDRKRKKQRIVDALERRRIRLLREGVTQWLSVATDFSCMRAKFAAQQQASDAFEKFQLTQRCALHWKRWAAKQKLNRISSSSKARGSKVILPEQLKLAYLPTKEFARKSDLELPPPIITTSPAKPQISGSLQNERLKSRRKPRHPSFLADSLKRAGLFTSDEPLSSEKAETQAEQDTKLPQLFHNDSEVNEMMAAKGVSFEDEVSTKLKENLTRTDSYYNASDSVNRHQEIPDGNRATVPEQILSSRTYVKSPSSVLLIENIPVSTIESVSPRIESQNTKDLSRVAHSLQTRSVDKLQGDVDKCELRLLTPADFMVTSTMRSEEIKDKQETYSPLSTPRMDNLMESLNSRDVNMLKPCGGQSSPSQQIISIRNRLKEFDRQKKRLRKLQKQQHQLSDWLKQEGVRGQDSELQDVQHELNEIKAEIEDIKNFMETEKPECARLVKEVERLVNEIQTKENG